MSMSPVSAPVRPSRLCSVRAGAGRGAFFALLQAGQRQIYNILEILDRLGDTTRGPELEGDPQEEKRATLSLPT